MRGVREHCNGENICFLNPWPSKIPLCGFNRLGAPRETGFPNRKKPPRYRAHDVAGPKSSRSFQWAAKQEKSKPRPWEMSFFLTSPYRTEQARLPEKAQTIVRTLVLGRESEVSGSSGG